MTTPLNNKKGTTLVELMVCLVLLALFGTAAVTLVKPCAEAYIEVQQLTRAQNLADALTETIRGELADADGHDLHRECSDKRRNSRKYFCRGRPSNRRKCTALHCGKQLHRDVDAGLRAQAGTAK